VRKTDIARRDAGTLYLAVHEAVCVFDIRRCSQPTNLFPTAMSSTSKQATDPSTSNFTSIFEAATNEYKKLTKKDLHTHLFAAQFDRCDSPAAVLDVFRRQAHAFEEFRKGDERLIQWLDPTVNILSTFSSTFGEALALVVSLDRSSNSFLTSVFKPFSPSKLIFAGISVLLTVRPLPCSLAHVCVTLNNTDGEGCCGKP
jgi:hypothetical protein